jgi:hypothetical protein
MARSAWSPDWRVRNAWAAKLQARGHRVMWTRVSRRPARHHAACIEYGREMECGNGRATGRLRRGRCRR